MTPVAVGILIIASILVVVLCAMLIMRHFWENIPVSGLKQVVPDIKVPERVPAAAKGLGAAHLRRKAYAVAFDKPEEECRLSHDQWSELLGEERQLVLENPQYSPRAPMVLPRLLQAMRSEDASGDKLVSIVQEDPGLTGDVLKLANSPYYRMTNEPVDQVSYAVVVLGVDGLRALVTASVMQPMFQSKGSRFGKFPALVWQQALDAAVAAQHYAIRYEPDAAFSAHLSTLITHYADIIIFKYIDDCYKKSSGLAPLPGSYIQAFRKHRGYFVRAIIHDWKLDDLLLGPLKDYFARKPIAEANVLTQAIYFGSLTGQLGLLNRTDCLGEADMGDVLVAHGAPQSVVPGMLKACLAA